MATVNTSLHGHQVTSTVTPDSTPDHFTSTTAFTTSGGVVNVMGGGSNAYTTSATKLGKTGVIAGDYSIVSSTDPAITTASSGSFESYTAVVGLQYAGFGVWSLNPCAVNASCTPVYAGTIAGGQPGVSETAVMPTTGTATYSGGAVGYVVQPAAINSNNAGQFYGDVNLTANFATNALSGSITGINAYSVNNGGSGQTLLGTINSIGLNATISGSAYAGNATVTGSAGTAFDISGATGNVAGAFYGPAANETSGVFYMTGGANSTQLMGSFGAKQAGPTAAVFTETASLSGTPGTNLTGTLASALNGQIATTSITGDSSPAGFTGHTTYTTPGGVVVTTFGGSNNYNTNNIKVGQTGVVNGDYTISSSTDPAVPTTGGGSFQGFAPVVGLQYSAFGVWNVSPCDNTSNCTPAYAGTFAGAQPGQALTVSMPTTGTATYSGGATGFVLQPIANNSNNVGQFYGTSSLTANFSTGSISGSITGINAYGVNGGNTLLGTVNNIGLSATISGSTFAGTANVTGSAGTAFDIAGATGTLKGGFYGPSANEVAGVFNLTGGANNTTLMGSFGAKQAPSDRRLKVDVQAMGDLPNGLRLYAWRYRGGAHRFTGVMAQDLMADPRFAGAVTVDDNGLMQVDYGMIGYLPPDFALMRKEGEAALANYRRSLH